ncbi:MAG: hypothetical protein MK538_09235, partial [Planctomycetes bacterium]|nr:hypothetical protein [Planctomycetota bacterium]
RLDPNHSAEQTVATLIVQRQSTQLFKASATLPGTEWARGIPLIYTECPKGRGQFSVALLRASLRGHLSTDFLVEDLPPWRN